MANQLITSKNTSINSTQLPRIFGYLVDSGIDLFGMSILDIGAGKFNNAVDWVDNQGGLLVPYDPYNRTTEENDKAMSMMGTFDMVICSNVLNVVKEQVDRDAIIGMAHRALTYDGIAYFTVYTGKNDCVGRMTGVDQWQENRPVATYLQEIKFFFDSCKIHKNVVIARK